MSGAKVIWVTPLSDIFAEDQMWFDTPGGEGGKYIRADAPELVALVAAARAVNHDSTHGNGLEGFRKNRDRLRIAFDQWDALQ